MEFRRKQGAAKERRTITSDSRTGCESALDTRWPQPSCVTCDWIHTSHLLETLGTLPSAFRRLYWASAVQPIQVRGQKEDETTTHLPVLCRPRSHLTFAHPFYLMSVRRASRSMALRHCCLVVLGSSLPCVLPAAPWTLDSVPMSSLNVTSRGTKLFFLLGRSKFSHFSG